MRPSFLLILFLLLAAARGRAQGNELTVRGTKFRMVIQVHNNDLGSKTQ